MNNENILHVQGVPINWTIYLKVVITVCDDKRKALHTYTKCLVLYME